MQNTGSDVERKVIAILKVISESTEPLGSITIARELQRHGVFLTERAVRYHLRITDERGYTQPLGRDGRMLTPKGHEELKVAMAPAQIGFIIEKLETLAFSTTFDPKTHTGQVPINTSLINRDDFPKAIKAMSSVFKAGLCVSDLVATASEGERLGSVVIPPGKMGLATICSVIINGVLLKAGVPIGSKFGGVLEVVEKKPRRFTAIIKYDGTSLDPSEQYIRSRMTSVRQAAKTGNGRILANFRELPALARAIMDEKINQLREAGINGVFVLGNTSEPVCQIPVELNRVGVILLGGLNPLAASVEAGIEVENIGESGLIDFQKMKRFRELQ